MGSSSLKIIYTDNYSYQGQAQNKIPHGKGQIFFNISDQHNCKRQPKRQQLKYIKNLKASFINGKIASCQFKTENHFQYQGQLNQKLQIPFDVKNIVIDQKNVKYIGNFENGNFVKGIIDSSNNLDKQNQYVCFTSGQYKGTSILDGSGYFYNISQKYIAIGQFKKGKLQNGFYISEKGQYYHGQFAQGNPNGLGCYSILKIEQIDKFLNFREFQQIQKAQCKLYIQKLLHNQINSKRCQSLKDLVYNGSFRNNKIHGKCQIHFKNGDFYKGKCKNGKIHGKGQYIFFQSKTKFKGNFYYGIPSGDFVIEYTQKSFINIKQKEQNILQKYEGQISNGLFNGMGTLHYKNGVIFKGCFLNGAKNGPGVLIYCQNKFKCLYMMNKIVGKLQKFQQQSEPS